MMMRCFSPLLLGTMLISGSVYADFLPPDQAFKFQAVSISHDRAELTWEIADDYYLYHDQFKVAVEQAALKLDLPQPQDKDDPNFGQTEVHYQQVKTTIPVKPNQQLNVQWQGCAESGLCYPVQRVNLHTDKEGLLPLQHLKTAKKNLFPASDVALVSQAKVESKKVASAATEIETALEKPSVIIPKEKLEQTVASDLLIEDQAVASQINIEETQVLIPKSQEKDPSITHTTMQSQWNNDQFFLGLLSDQNTVFNLLIFFGLGILLAFLPCSLPLIPILSGILVQQYRGYRAAIIAFVFCFSMAMVYALMGWVVTQLGYGFQRWFQNPIFIGFFSFLFIAFALNLFGAFQLSLPQHWLHKLDQWQQRQKNGTLLGASAMGILAALIVGPCMSAPLAGALLFVSQLNQPIMGAMYLFILGLGIGFPLFIAAVFGSHYLPKPGLWMDRLKFSFGFIMLLLALYFARPLLNSTLYFIILAGVLASFALYVLWKLRPNVQRPITKSLLIFSSLLLISASGWHIHQAIKQSQTKYTTQLLSWQVVQTEDELTALLQQHPQRTVLIDVYADWCVACQPIERDVLPRRDVQQPLDQVLRVKLDLTHAHPSHDALLKKWQILGPPTFIFLDKTHHEQRYLRLTGTFTATQLIHALEQQKNVRSP